MAMELNMSNFDETIQSATPVLVDFWAPWCGPCRMLSPVLEMVETSMAGKFTLCKVNVDENAELAARYGIMSIPALLLFKNGQLVDQSVGFVAQSAVEALISKAL